MTRIAMLPWIVLALAGCASNLRGPGHDWTTRADAIATQRLAVAPHAGQARAAAHEGDVSDTPLHLARSAALDSKTCDNPLQGLAHEEAGIPQPRKPLPDGRGSDFWSGAHRSAQVWQPVSFALLAADVPESQPSAQPPPEPSAAEAPVERGPLPGFFDTVKRDLKAMPDELWHDTKATFGNPYNLVFLLGAGGVSGAVRCTLDDRVEDYYDGHHSMKADWRDAFGAMGNPGTHFAAAGVWYLVGQQFQDAKTYEVGKRMFSALTITGVTTIMLKLAACDEAPNGEDWAWPSGHVSSTMAMATVLNNAYGPLVGVPMFGLTGLVGLERLDSGEHYLSDLVFGAALGWVVAETVMKEHRPEVFGGQIVPYADPVNGNAGLAWVKPLGR